MFSSPSCSLQKLLVTDRRDLSALFLRLALGVVILAHGLQKSLGWFGGKGVEATVQFFTQGLGIPAALALLVILAESLGALSLILGFFTRFCALSIGIVMAGAVILVHAKNGFFTSNGGYEFHILAITMAIVLVMRGGGAYALDLLLVRHVR